MSSSNIYSFKPTFLYIKQHSVTGMMYFGKTTRNPERYCGSGKYWAHHIKKHGKEHVVNLWYCLFYDEQECRDFAISFSNKNNIVKSNEWANLIEENGIDGAPLGHVGHIFTEEQKEKISKWSKNVWLNPEYKKMMSEKRKWTEERKIAQSEKLKGIKRPDHSEKLKGRKASEEFIAFTKRNRSEKHKNAISIALSGKTKSEDHKTKLKKPKPIAVTRICDRRPMSMGNFMNWCRIQDKKIHNLVEIK